MGNGVSWHDVRDMPPPELADLMLRVCDPSFGKHHQAIIGHAVGGGIVCGLGEKPLRDFLTHISITLKPQQDFIIQALEELRRNTEVAVAALDASGSPFKHTVVRNLRTHHAAYVTFTQEGDTFRGATKFAKSLRKTINSAWDPPSAPVTVRLRGGGTLGVTPGPLLHEVAQSLNVVWLISDGSLEDPFCLMEVCAAVRQGTPVLPVRFAGDGMRPLNLPIWGYSISTKPPRSAAGATVDPKSSSNSTCRTTDIMPNANDSGRDAGGEQELNAGGGNDKTAIETRERAARLRRRVADRFYMQLAQHLPKPTQVELHRNNFLVKDVIAAVRACFESAEEADAGPEHAFAGAISATPDGANPPIFDLSAPPVDHQTMLTALVGANGRKTGEEGAAGVADRQEREESSPLWNWEHIPRTAPLAGRARVNDAVPWRTEEETLEMIRMEDAEADDLAGLLVKDMLTHPGSENHLWEGCKSLADLAARDSDGLSAVRRQGGIQAVLVALAACPKDADVQRWGCQALVPLFGDPVVAAPFRQAGVAAVVRALAVLQDVETALKSMGAVGAPGMASAGGGVGGGGRPKANVIREKWARAMKKIEVGRVKEQRRASLDKKEAAVRELEKQEAELAQRIEARRKSLELEVLQDIESDGASELAGTDESATTSAPNASGSPTNLGSVERLSSEGKNTGNDDTLAYKDEGGRKQRENGRGRETKNYNDSGSDEGGDDSDGLAALADEQRRLEEQDRLEHEAEMARLKKVQEENKPDPWAMTDADIAVYDKAFIKQDKDKDGCISLHEAKSMFEKARASKEARRRIWELADPYQRGKLTQHGWRVAYHLARSTKKRKLQIPETLPRCLYPPGHAPVVTPPVEGKDDAGGVIEKLKNQTKKAVGGESKKRPMPAKGGAAVVKGGKVAAGTGKGKGRTKGGGGAHEEAKVGGAKASLNKKKTKNGDGKERAAGTKQKRRSVRGKATSSMPNASSEEMNDTDKNAEEYRMSKSQHARYNKMFDKLTKRRSVQTIDGAEAAAILAKSGLSKADLGHLWTMADADRDGKLCRREFAVAMHLAACAVGKDGPPLPATLPPCLASATATVAATASDKGGEDKVGEVEGRVILVDDAKSVVSSLGYPEGLSDLGSEKGDVVGDTSDNTPREEKSRKMSQAASVAVRGSDAPDPKRDTPKMGDGGFGDMEATGAKRKTGGKTEGDREEGEEAIKEEGKERDFRYAMSDRDTVRYGKAFDKLVKGKGTKNLGGKEAAVILAKSGLGKAELGRLWAISDADRDGALSRVEFSIAMHLASCSANKDLPVPSVLPGGLAALLSRRTPIAEGGKKNMRGKRNQTPETSSAPSPDEGCDGSGRPHRSVEDGGKDTGKALEGAGRVAEKNSCAAVRNKAGGQAAGKGRTTKSGSKEEAGKDEQAKRLENAETGAGDKTAKRAATAEKENRASRKRGFGIFSSSAGTKEAQHRPRADNKKMASKSAAAANDRGGKKKKIPKTEMVGDDRENPPEREDVAVTGKRMSLSGNRQPAGSKLRSAKSSKEREKQDSSAATAGAAAVGGVVAGSDSTESIAKGKHKSHGTGEDGSSTKKKQSEEGGDSDDEEGAGTQEGSTPKKKKGKNKPLSREEEDQLYAMSTSERAGYDVIFMQIDADHSGTIDGREAATLLGRSGLTSEQLKTVWELTDKNGKGEIDHDDWAVAMHLSRCVAQKQLPLPDVLPRSLGGPGQPAGSFDGDDGLPGGEGQHQPKGSKARQEAEQARDEEKQVLARRAVKLREHTEAFRLGKVTAAAFYITIAQAFGSKRHTMIPKVARSLPLDKARALVAAAGLGEDVLEDDVATEQKLKQLRRRRIDQVNLHVKSTTSGATARDVQLLACRLANRLCCTLDDESNVGGMGGGGKVGATSGGGGLGDKATVAAQMASAGCVNAVALIFRMFEALDLELMREALQLSLVLARACAVVPADDSSAPETSSLASASGALAMAEKPAEPSPLLPLLRPLYTPSTCKRISEVAKQFPHSRNTQRLCCLFVGQLGSTCGAPARRCFADCCEPIVAAAAGSLDEHAASDSEGSSMRGGGGNETPSLHREGVRDVACQALAVFAKEPGLSRRLVAAGAGQAVTRAMEAAPRDFDVQLSSLETMAMLTEHNRGMWDDEDDGRMSDSSELPVTIDAPCRAAVHSIQTFVRDPNIHRAASQAILALLVSDAAESAARSVAAAGGATALSRVLATSPTNGEVQLPAILAINELLGRRRRSSSISSSSNGEIQGMTKQDCCSGQAPTDAIVAAEAAKETVTAAEASQKVEREFIAAAGCELLCKSAKTFPRDRELRLGCLRAMGALCRGAPETAVDRLVDGGVCEQLMKVVEAYPGDMEVRRAGLTLLVGIAEHGDGTSGTSDDEEGGIDDRHGTLPTSSTAASGALVTRLGFVGAVSFAAAWLREATAPVWAWVGAGYGGGHDALGRAQDLLMSCEAAFFLTHHSSSNRDRLSSMGAIEALTRAVAISGSKDGFDDVVGHPKQAEDGLEQMADKQQDPVVSIQAKTQVWAAQALAELAGGHDNESRCLALVRSGSLRALFAAMNKSRSAKKLQRAGCIALGNVAGCLKIKELHALGRRGGAQAVTAAFKACPGDKDVAFAGLLAVSKLSISSENRRLLGEAGACPLISKKLHEFSGDEAVAEEGCRAVTRIAALSGFNRTGLGLAGAAQATATALLNHPSKPMVQRWGLSAAAALVAETDPSGNTDRVTRAGILDLAVQALAKFRHNPTVQAEGLKTFAKVATSGEDGANAVWAAGVVLPTVRALGLYLNDANVQHWGSSTVRVLTGGDDKCEAWRGAGAPEAVVRALIAFGKGGTGRHARHDEEGLGRSSETRLCTDDESLCIQFQACAAALNLAASSPDARRRIVREGAGEALAGMMRNNSSNLAAQQGALATLAVLSASGVENRKRLHRYKGGVPKAVVFALETFPDDRRVRCEGVLAVQNLSLTAGGARAMIKAGAAPVVVRLLRGAPMKEDERALAAGTDETVDGDHLDRNVIVYLLNGLASMATANKSLSDFVGRHGACQAIVSALEQRPRDLQLQASGIKAVRALALGGGRNVEVLADVRGPTAIARAAGMFLRDREIQLACLGAEEILCRGGNRASRDALVAAGSVHLLESALLQLAGDAEVVSQGFRALVEIVLLGENENAKGERLDAEHEEKKRCHRKAEVDESPSVGSVGLPRLNLIGEDTTAVAEPTRPCKDLGASGIDVDHVSRAVETVLAALERNPCREVSLSAFAALNRLIVNLGAEEPLLGVGAGSYGDQLDEGRDTATRTSTKRPQDETSGGDACAEGSFQLARVRYAVKRALKINGTSEAGLASRGGKILTLVAVARGRALAQ